MRPSILLSLLAAAGLAGAFVPSRPTLARAGVKMSMGTDVSRGDFVRAGAAAAAAAGLSPASPAEAAARSPTDLLREIVTTKPLNRKLIKWYSKNLSEDFTGSFAKGKIVLPKAAYIAVCEGLLASVPDFVYTCPSGEFREEDLGGGRTRITTTWVVKGTHTGAPYSPIPGVPAVAAQTPPRACQNDSELLTWEVQDGKVTKLVVDAIKGGRGFSGPVGFYLQMGGNKKDLPKM